MLQNQHIASKITGVLMTAAAAAGIVSPDVVNGTENSNTSTNTNNSNNNGNRHNQSLDKHHRRNTKKNRNRNRKKKKKKKKSLTKSASSPSLDDDNDDDDEDGGGEDFDLSNSDTSSIDEYDEDLAKILPPTIRSTLRQRKKESSNSMNKNDDNKKKNHQSGHRESIIATASATTTNTVSTSVSITPQEQLRKFLISKQGLSAKVIDDVIEQMWDENLSYDDPQAVVDYINKERHSTSTGSEGLCLSSSNQSFAIFPSTFRSTGEEQEQSVTSDICPSNLFLSEGEDQSSQTADKQTVDENRTANHDPLTFSESISQSFDNINNIDGEVRETSSSARMIGISSEGDLATSGTVEMTFDTETLQAPPLPCTQRNHYKHFRPQIDHQHQHTYQKNNTVTGALQRNPTAKNGLVPSIKTADAIVDDNHKSSSPKNSSSHIKSGRLSIAEKLDIVADFDNLPDAIFALTEWINKAAKPNEVSQIEIYSHIDDGKKACPMTYSLTLRSESLTLPLTILVLVYCSSYPIFTSCRPFQKLDELCKAQMTTALPTVLRRGIVESADQSKDDTVVISSLLRMFSSMLSRCDVDYDAVEEIEANLEDVLVEARNVYTALSDDTNTNTKNNEKRDRISERVVEFVTILLSNVVSESHATAIKSCPSREDDPISTLVWKRDMQKIEAKRACTSARFSLNSALGTLGDGQDSPTLGTRQRQMPINFDLSYDDIVISLVGEEREERTSIDLQKVIIEESQNQSYIDGIYPSIREPNDSLINLVSEQATVRGKMKKVKATLAVLKEQDEILSQRIGDLKSRMLRQRLVTGARTIMMNEQLELVQASVQYGESIDSLVDAIMTYKRSMKKIFRKADEPTDPSISMTLCLQHSRNYFLSETECIEELRHRVQTNKTDLSKLEYELGPSDTATQQDSTGMEEDISLLKMKIETDSKRAASFREDAYKMFEDLMNQLEYYQVAASAEATTIEPIQTDLLNDISVALETLGLPGSRLDNYFLTTYRPIQPQDCYSIEGDRL